MSSTHDGRFGLFFRRSAAKFGIALAFLSPALSSLRSFPLDSIFARGDSSVNMVWTPDSMNTRPDWFARCCPSIARYRHCDFLPGVEYRGQAYSYGGEDGYALFRTRLARGDLVGSHDCHYKGCGDPSDSVTGTDCSGFVCYVWNVPRQSTGGIASNTRYIRISMDSLRPGDILVKAASHVVLVVEVDFPEVLLWESYGWPVNGCRERVVNLERDTTWKQFVPLRNPAIPGYAGVVVQGGRRGSAGMVLGGRNIARVSARMPEGSRAVVRSMDGRIIAGRGSTAVEDIAPGVYTFEVIEADGVRRTARMVVP